MKNDNASERAVTLMRQAVNLLRLVETAPPTPVNTYLPAKLRRALRRDAVRLRQGKAEPRFKNLHTAEQLAAIYERTAQCHEVVEWSVKDIKQIARDLARLREEHPSEVQQAMETFVLEVQQSAEAQGPGSEAAMRYRIVERLASFGHEQHVQSRRQRTPAPQRIVLTPDSSFVTGYEQAAAEVLTSPPSADEKVIAIPPEGQDSGRGRIFLRIGTGQSSWIGSFERGHAYVSTIFMLPDGKHLFVSAEGAGYVIDAQSRTLVETTGTRVAGTMRNAAMTLYVVDHDGMSLEAFGRTGRLWKTGNIGSGGFRSMALREEELVGEARYPTRTGWAWFSVKLATGEVEIDASGAGTE
ncbi:MAG TPA: hypothetical protein VGF69_11690 [Thermoanaerobaculia bacterium]|jgi:hypothetical protein